jgi:hypothetical protein
MMLPSRDFKSLAYTIPPPGLYSVRIHNQHIMKIYAAYQSFAELKISAMLCLCKSIPRQELSPPLCRNPHVPALSIYQRITSCAAGSMADSGIAQQLFSDLHPPQQRVNLADLLVPGGRRP